MAQSERRRLWYLATAEERRAYKKAWYEKNKARHMAGVKANKLLNQEKNREVVWGHLLTHPCVDCGETDPVVLEFDHVRGEKEFNISRMMIDYSAGAILAEVAKCEVRCANCHRRATYERCGSWRCDFALRV